MKKYLQLLLIITISSLCLGCAQATAWIDGTNYVEDVIAGRINVIKPEIDLTGEWKIRIYYRTTICTGCPPEQDHRGTITLKAAGNGWTGEMDYIDINHSNKRTIQPVLVVLSGDKLTMFSQNVTYTEWVFVNRDLFTGNWDPIKQEFAGSSMGNCTFVMRR